MLTCHFRQSRLRQLLGRDIRRNIIFRPWHGSQSRVVCRGACTESDRRTSTRRAESLLHPAKSAQRILDSQPRSLPARCQNFQRTSERRFASVRTELLPSGCAPCGGGRYVDKPWLRCVIREEWTR